ncbi:hypothetical protein [Gordonia humi]|uniref:Uncharacterized protein n=2 Tax=Gordonia humi TaxID=686429 RepID=A0A840FDK9_9ACTN|nr:hypothetical protein [Gordonia humi]MBB4138200.1 hypothetical protein [Gordonia humi]
MAESLDPEFVDLIDTIGHRRSAILATAAQSVADDVRRDADYLDTAAAHSDDTGLQVVHLLPEITWSQSKFWRHQLAAAADRIAHDIQRWGAPVPRCTAEEMTVHLALRRAAVLDTGLPARWAMTTSDRGGLPDTWGDLGQYLVQDDDVLMLYDVPPEAVAELAGGVNLSPTQWFTEFTTPFPMPDR